MTTPTSTRTAFGIGAVALGVLIGAAGYSTFVDAEPALAGPSPASVTAPAASPAALTDEGYARGVSLATADLAERVTPAVVQISVQVTPRAATTSEIPEGLRRFFDPFGGSTGPQAEPQPRFGGGSGFLISADGYIVTNNHVAGDAEKIVVRLHDNRTFDAELVGTDPTTDVAVIKIDAAGLPFLSWGDSRALRVGEWVMAVGNPGFGGSSLDYTVTTGIVSAKGRPLQLLGRDLEQDPRFGREMAGYAIENFIQTDAVINPGNSGGPMVDMGGRVVGINSAIASTDGHFQGYGFAIPAALAEKVAHDLVTEGRVLRPWLGVQVVEVSPEDAEAFDLPRVSGVLVQGVTDDSPAAGAGLEQGDVLVSLNGVDITSGGDLQEKIAVLDQGARVELGYYRSGASRNTTVRLGAAPVDERAVRETPGARSDAPAEVQRLGLVLRPLDEGVARQLGYDRAGGVVVADVDPAGPAALKGIGAGTRVLEVDGHPVASVHDASEALAEVSSGQVVTLLLATPDQGTRLVNVRAR